MTSIFFASAAGGRFASMLQERLARGLPAGCVLAGNRSDITLTHDGKAPDGDARVWSLLWSDGTPLANLATLAHAACRAHAVQEICIAERTGEEWHIIARAAFCVQPGNWRATLTKACERAALMIAGALKNSNPPKEAWATGRTLSTGHALPLLLGIRLLWRRLCDKIRRVAFYEHWMIGVVDAPVEASPGWKTCPPPTWLDPGAGKFYLADPFAWPGDTQTLLCEEYEFATRRGSIVRLSVSGDGIAEKTPVAFPVPGHLSFPFLFENGGDVYCMPESSAAQRLILFKWEKDAFKEYATPLSSARAADGVLFEHEGQFWIAYTDLAIGAFDNLNLLHAPCLKGPWKAHPGNPVKLDPRSSRSAGPLFHKDGALFRPAQDCSKTYGGAIRILRITECTPSRFREEEVTVIAPARGPNPHGLHTLSSLCGKTLIDGKRMVFSLPLVLRKVWRALRAKIIPYRFLYTREGM